MEESTEDEYEEDCNCRLCREGDVWDTQETQVNNIEELYKYRQHHYPGQRQAVDHTKVFKTLWALKEQGKKTRIDTYKPDNQQNKQSAPRFRLETAGKTDKYDNKALEEEKAEEKRREQQFLQFYEQSLSVQQSQHTLLYEGQYQSQLELYRLKTINRQKITASQKENTFETVKKGISQVYTNNHSKRSLRGKVSNKAVGTFQIKEQAKTSLQTRHNVFQSIRI